ncbi:MAG: YbjQ family protein, partial [Myxococcota bacterium]|nr:YbjQ family protein [Myxococcota bacterium]
RGELPEVTKMIYEARENCLELVRREADALGAERVMSTRLEIREIGQGLVEIVAIGTAVVPAAPSMQPQTPQLLPQALVADGDHDDSIETLGFATAPMQMVRSGAGAAGQQTLGCLIALIMFFFVGCCSLIPVLMQALGEK